MQYNGAVKCVQHGAAITRALSGTCKGSECPPVFTVLRFWLLVTGKSRMHRVAAHLYCRRQNELVMDYLHQSDGKKRI